MKITTNEVREKYLKHFEKMWHVIIPSSRLVPENDPTTLFTGSGMQPMVPYLLGQKHPLGTRITDSQKCFRSQDIEEVGDNRHTTFFEMLGNWSLGDYFKEEQIAWMWDFLVNELKLDVNKIYFTCFKGAPEIGVPKDTDSAQWWQMHFKNIGIDVKIGENPEVDGMKEGEKIFYYNAKKNWWSRAGVPQNMPVGEPGGPDTEMFFDFDPELKNDFHNKSVFKQDKCHPNCDCGRFMEIGNNVFMEYVKTESGYEKLPAPNVDFGGGLERMAAALNDNSDVFKIDIFTNVIETIEKLSGKKYNPIVDDKEILGVDKMTQSFRVILDHLRAATFLIADDILPGNKDQNYFVRRLLRRAIRNGRNLGIQENFCKNIAESYIEVYKSHYKEVLENRNRILLAVEEEEVKFNKTLQNGEKEFFNIIKALAPSPSERAGVRPVLSGELAFMLYESYGFPVEIIEDLCKENNLTLDKNGFEEARAKHSQMSRVGSEQKFKGGLADSSEMVTKYHTATHLLHQALKIVLGEEANQKGSNITSERLRFDFSHNQKMTPEEIQKTENLVNEWIEKDLIVRREEMQKPEAESRNPIHLFGEKYGDVVSIYTIAENETGKVRGVDATSVEFCGGPHVSRTGEIGVGENGEKKKFKIIKEEAVSAGVRRIKAVVE